MVVLFGLTAFAGAALMFAVEPMAAKALLPMLGGTASVWSTCLAFFQTALLLGYFYAHASSRLAPRGQAVAHLALLIAIVLIRPAIVISPSDHPPASGADPTAWLVGTLATTLGLPFVALAATSSLLQRWYAASRSPGEANPYPLYAASNLGSLLALLAYPLALEPSMPLAAQARAWQLGFVGFAALMAGCAAVTLRPSQQLLTTETPSRRPDRWAWLTWIALAFIPSSLLQGVTTYLTTDIAPIPLLWVVPLGLYLLSFILTFASRPPIPQAPMIRAVPIAALVLLPPMAAGLVQWFWMPVHLLFFFVAAMACHGELARRRPPPEGLTGFYLAIAVGGVLGSFFNAILAPIVFDRMAEYPIGIALACLVPSLGSRERVRTSLLLAGTILGLTSLLAADPGGLSATAPGALCVSSASGLFLYVTWTLRRRPVAFGLSVGAILLGTGLSPGVGGRILRRERNFYGILRVTEDDRAHARRLFHGWTLHGQQSTEPGREREPTTYYLPGGPASQVIGALDAREDVDEARVAVVGLGIGGLASYARPGQSWTFYELDPAVEAVARDASLFTYLRDSPAASVDVVIGDARLRLADADRTFDLIVLDAFSSDAIPIHLLTREALGLYLAKLAPSGLIAYHISTRHLDLEPVLGALAAERGLIARIRRDLSITPEEKKVGKQPTVWAVLADRAADLGPIAADPRWTPARAGPSAWTDDRSSLLDVLAIGRGARGGP